jgi:hypothetical protein
MMVDAQTTEVRHQPEGGGGYVHALRVGSGVNRVAGDPGSRRRNAVPDLIRDLSVGQETPDQVRGCGYAR